MKNWETVYKNENKITATLLLDELLANGLDAVLIDKKDSLYPMIGFAEIRVLVNEETEARDIINNFNAKETN